MADAPSDDSGTGNIFLFFGIMLIIFLAWVVTGGPSRPLSLTGPYLGTNGVSVSGTPSYVSAPQTVGVGTTQSGSVVSLLRDTSGASSTDENKEYITIMISSLANGPVSTAGWRLVSAKTGRGASFPRGTEVPQSGKVNTLTAIELAPGSTAMITSGRSPIGVSFRENKCTGYLEERQDFYPPLNQNCPTPFQELARFYDADDSRCAEYVRGISYCSAETRSSSKISASCEDFVDEHLNYNGCVRSHTRDSDFANGTWRIFLGSDDELWKRSGETIELIDAGGNVLDRLSY